MVQPKLDVNFHHPLIFPVIYFNKSFQLICFPLIFSINMSLTSAANHNASPSPQPLIEKNASNVRHPTPNLVRVWRILVGLGKLYEIYHHIYTNIYTSNFHPEKSVHFRSHEPVFFPPRWKTFAIEKKKTTDSSLHLRPAATHVRSLCKTACCSKKRCAERKTTWWDDKYRSNSRMQLVVFSLEDFASRLGHRFSLILRQYH